MTNKTLILLAAAGAAALLVWKSRGVTRSITQGFTCQCLNCGYMTTSTAHCFGLTCPVCGGQMRRYERPGPGQPITANFTDPAYMRGDSEIPELRTSTNDYGGTLDYQLLPIARLQ